MVIGSSVWNVIISFGIVRYCFISDKNGKSTNNKRSMMPVVVRMNFLRVNFCPLSSFLSIPYLLSVSLMWSKRVYFKRVKEKKSCVILPFLHKKNQPNCWFKQE